MTVLFGRGVVGLEGRGASLEASPLALGLPGLEAGARPGRQARLHVALGQHHPKPAAHHHVALGLPILLV